MACEHISHEFALGRVSEQGVKLNLEEIAQKYNEQYYSKITPVCKKMLHAKSAVHNACSIRGFKNRKSFVVTIRIMTLLLSTWQPI